MRYSDLQSLVAGGEGERLEFKETTGQRSIAVKTVCAMLNGVGGYLLFGVKDDGTIIGQDVSEKTLQMLVAELRKIEPPAFPDIQTVPMKSGRSVIVLLVQGGGGPYTTTAAHIRATDRRLPSCHGNSTS
jgi:ATP-dependent DNA helicase RecG